ncbi:MAG TPA: polymer-forming cytoskeletal protein [Anaerolineales bacterium]|nr:polymer-forming cytoskeletal protein [Anaerolineales bacterium]
MFRRRDDEETTAAETAAAVERITSVLGDGTTYIGKLTGHGGIRIEGVFEGEIKLNGLLVIGPTGRVTCEDLRAKNVIVAGVVRGDITANKVEIRASGRVWGNVTTLAFATEEGAFLRGQIQMEEELELDLPSEETKTTPPAEKDETPEEDKGAEETAE